MTHTVAEAILTGALMLAVGDRWPRFTYGERLALIADFGTSVPDGADTAAVERAARAYVARYSDELGLHAAELAEELRRHAVEALRGGGVDPYPGSQS